MIERSLFAFAIDRTGKGTEMAAPAARYGRPVAVKLTRYELEKMFKRA